MSINTGNGAFPVDRDFPADRTGEIVLSRFDQLGGKPAGPSSKIPADPALFVQVVILPVNQENITHLHGFHVLRSDYLVDKLAGNAEILGDIPNCDIREFIHSFSPAR